MSRPASATPSAWPPRTRRSPADRLGWSGMRAAPPPTGRCRPRRALSALAGIGPGVRPTSPRRATPYSTGHLRPAPGTRTHNLSAEASKPHGACVSSRRLRKQSRPSGPHHQCLRLEPMPAREGVDRVTLAQVASEAGVSLSTVSKVLNGRTDVSPGTRQRVEELLTTHGYRRRAPTPPEAPLIEIVFHELESAWAME